MQNTEIFSQNTERFFMGCTGLGLIKKSVFVNYEFCHFNKIAAFVACMHK